MTTCVSAACPSLCSSTRRDSRQELLQLVVGTDARGLAWARVRFQCRGQRSASGELEKLSEALLKQLAAGSRSQCPPVERGCRQVITRSGQLLRFELQGKRCHGRCG